MTYFVYIDLASTNVPHMEPLDADCPMSATAQASMHLWAHASGTAAHIYEGDMCVASVIRERAGSNP